MHIPNHQITHTMETITITHRIINGKSIYNKRFDNYDKGFFGNRITKAEYLESRKNEIVFEDVRKGGNELFFAVLNICERVTYNN